MAGLTDAGFEIKTLETIVQEVVDGIHADVDPRVDVSAASPTGNFVGILMSKVSEVWELGKAVHSNQYPDSASGFGLTSVASITGTKRDPAFPSEVLCNLFLNGGATYVAGSLKANVNGDPLSRFHNAANVVVGGVGAQAVTGVKFISDANGPVRANAGTLTEIAEAVAGFNSITNPLDATLGALIEGDTDLRIRREKELATRGSTNSDALYTALLKVAGVISVSVLSNETDITDAQGLLPHSVEAIVRGGSDADIAQALWATKGGGTGTNGTTSVTVTDSQGVIHTVKFTRPTVLTVWLEIHLTAFSDTYGGDTSVEDTLVDYGDTNFKVGEDVVLSRLSAEIFKGVTGIDDVTTVLVGLVNPPVGTVNLPVALRELADLDTARITVVATLI
jgi:uncharacterized phage protein gp47/JayE